MKNTGTRMVMDGNGDKASNMSSAIPSAIASAIASALVASTASFGSAQCSQLHQRTINAHQWEHECEV